MRKNTVGMLLVFIGAAIGVFAAIATQQDISNKNLLMLLLLFLSSDLETIQIVFLIFIFASPGYGWVLIYIGFGACFLGGVLAAVD